MAGALPLAISTSGSVDPGSLDLALASEKATVTTKSGRTYEGLLSGFDDGRLSIRVATDGGEVGYSLSAEEIEAFIVPGAGTEAEANDLISSGHTAEALPLLAALARQRSPYLPLLDRDQSQPLFALVELAGSEGDPHTAIGYARMLLPYAETPEDRTILREAILQSHLRLGLDDEARKLAREWCRAADPTGPSAFGWSVLARLDFEDGDFAHALWLALQPIVFASHLPTKHLDECYAIAIAAADRKREAKEARALLAEMRQRGLAWPNLPALHGFDPSSLENAASTQDEPVDAVRPSANKSAKPPTTLESVRKLVVSPSL